MAVSETHFPFLSVEEKVFESPIPLRIERVLQWLSAGGGLPYDALVSQNVSLGLTRLTMAAGQGSAKVTRTIF